MVRDEPEWVETFGQAGFAILDRVISPGQVAELIEVSKGWSVVGRSTGAAGRFKPGIGTVTTGRRSSGVAESPELRKLVVPILGPRAFAVRGLYFDKTPETNWNLPWHQDLTIAVRSRREMPGFGPWTLKVGIPHVNAPADLLARMITIRLHLDECGPESGPMRVLRGSHAFGKLSPGRVAEWSARAAEFAEDCLVSAGSAVVMRPLILHSSTSATGQGHRRVIHIEYAAESLPDGLAWYEPN